MCGIIGYIGEKNAKDIIMGGLYALEYRGYDSAGMSVRTADGNVATVKVSGRVSELEKTAQELSGNCGIGHTRWATHGAPTKANAHPHLSDTLTLVHNGIIDNCLEIKESLEKQGYIFKSDTDTECASHLIDSEYKKDGKPDKAIMRACLVMRGSFALAIVFFDRPGEIWAVRRDNPLIAAQAPDGCYIASDIPAILPHSREIVRPAENVVLCIKNDGITLFYPDGHSEIAKSEHIEYKHDSADKGKWDHFMIKEINEQPHTVVNAASHRIGANLLPDFSFDGISHDFWKKADSIAIVSCGSATHAGLVGKYMIENLAKIPVTVNTASEYRYNPSPKIGNTVVIPISQSGETADTLAAMRLAKSFGLPTAAIVNAVGSAIAREADHVMYTHAGPEIAVATTKGYLTQVVLLSIIAAELAYVKEEISEEEVRKLCHGILHLLPEAVSDVISRRDSIKKLAEKIYTASDLYYIGRGPDYHVSAECSLKLKEISYIHSEAYAAGELKHGTLSLIEEGTPVIALASDSRYYDKMTGNIREVRARGGYVILVCRSDFPKPQEYCDDVFYLPDLPEYLSSIPAAVFSQILAYETSLLLGCDVDHPRNLAKSVTVE